MPTIAEATDTPRTRRRQPVSPLAVLGTVLLVAAVVCLGWVAWQYVGTTIISREEAAKEMTALETIWDQSASPSAQETAEGPPAVADSDMGSAQWIMRIPALGSDWVWPVMAGVGVEDLTRGVGWYPTTAQPGQVGNFAVAGHRVTHGEPFRRMLELAVGATVIIETRASVFTYELVSAPDQLTVQDTETWVLDPVPGNPEAIPGESLITLTTCEDLFHSSDRSVAFGKLVSTEAK